MDISRKNQEQIAGDNSTQNQVVGTQNNTYVTVTGASIPDVTEFKPLYQNKLLNRHYHFVPK